MHAAYIVSKVCISQCRDYVRCRAFEAPDFPRRGSRNREGSRCSRVQQSRGLKFLEVQDFMRSLTFSRAENSLGSRLLKEGRCSKAKGFQGRRVAEGPSLGKIQSPRGSEAFEGPEFSSSQSSREVRGPSVLEGRVFSRPKTSRGVQNSRVLRVL